MSQTTVSEFRANFVAGQISDPSVAKTRQKVAETATAILPGEVVIKGTLEDDVTGVAAAFTQTTFRGISIHSGFANEKALSTGVNSYADQDPIPIMEAGTIAVLLGEDVTEGGIGYFVHTVGASALHTWRSDLDTNKASQVPGRYLQDGVSGEVILLKLDDAAGLGSVLT